MLCNQTTKTGDVNAMSVDRVKNAVANLKAVTQEIEGQKQRIERMVFAKNAVLFLLGCAVGFALGKFL